MSTLEGVTIWTPSGSFWGTSMAAQDFSSGCVLEPWFVDALRDPSTKLPLAKFVATNGVLDLRPAAALGDQWAAGQRAYEAWEQKQIKTQTVDEFRREISGVVPVYEKLPIIGACLDVGGLDGRIRAFMAPNQRYACVDPYPGAISDIAKKPALTTAYPALQRPVNFVCGVAEYLPIADQVFDTVHMRSVIDHFEDPARALKEAYRVLKAGGQVIIGVSVEGGVTGVPSVKERARETLRSMLVAVGVERYRDHHVWHPTWPALRTLIESAGFTCDDPFWQNPRVVYVRGSKPAA